MENEGQAGSQAMQDAFVMLCTGRKRDGTYVDLGAGHYANGSNTFRLATEYGWSGIAAEKDEALAAEYRRTRWRDTFFDDALDARVARWWWAAATSRSNSPPSSTAWGGPSGRRSPTASGAALFSW